MTNVFTESFLNDMGLCPCTPDTSNTIPHISIILPNENEHSILNTIEPDSTTQDSTTTTIPTTQENQIWQIVYTIIVLIIMFAALLSDKVGADMVMLTGLSLFMVAEIISIREAIEGFANEGLLTVLVLFVVAAGISHTGALDWYMGKLLGRPKNTASAQLRLMIPIAIVSAFLNNTPVVAVMIPIIQKWGKNIGVNPQQLLIPLSFASILGGTCTLIGTSTNLVVVGLLDVRYANDPTMDKVQLFDLGIYGVPVALVGMAYVLLLGPFLIPGGPRFISSANSSDEAVMPGDLDDSILLGARLTKWSAAVGRSIKRSGLRDTGGLYLVSVHRAATGNIHRAVGQEFVLNVGDILYFTGLVEGFGEFCQENGLEVITNEVEDAQDNDGKSMDGNHTVDDANGDVTDEECPHSALGALLPAIEEEDAENQQYIALSDHAERMRNINQMQDLLRGIAIPEQSKIVSKKETSMSGMLGTGPPKIFVLAEKDEASPLVIVAISTNDRPGLLLDVSKVLIRLGLNFHHTEARVLEGRSLSLWRCEPLKDSVTNHDEVWAVLNAMLESESGIEAVKHRGLRVIRAIVTKQSELIGSTATESDFREKYQAAIIGVQRGGQTLAQKLSQIRFAASDILVLQASDTSPLLIKPPRDFYKKMGVKPSSSMYRFVKKKFGSFGSLSDLADRSRHSNEGSSVRDGKKERKKDTGDNMDSDEERDKSEEKVLLDNMDIVIGGSKKEEGHQSDSNTDNVESQAEADENENKLENERVWKDLAVAFPNAKSDSDDDDATANDEAVVSREFLTAMVIAPRSQLANKSVAANGLNKLPGVFLVGVERSRRPNSEALVISTDGFDSLEKASSFEDTEIPSKALHPDELLKEGDILWFSGSANAVGDLRKIPGLKSQVSDEVKKINEKVHDRRLVQAVISRKGHLVGRTVQEARFRTRYGAAVIAVHREGKRVQEHPGKIKLQAGDVLLLEAGSAFIRQNAENDKSFALLSEVADSAPPRLRLLTPALVLTFTMLAVYTAGVASLLTCSLLASIVMVCIGILSQQEVRDAVNWDIYVTIACAFGIGTALTNSGVAGGIANGLVKLGQAIGIGDAGLYASVYFATFLISNVVTNNAAAALIFPIAMDAAEMTGADRKLMSFTLMLGASASFMSPFGYTTNLLIYGPGGYKYADFLRIGVPMQIILWFVSVIIISTSEGGQWYWSWIVSSILLFLICFFNILKR